MKNRKIIVPQDNNDVDYSQQKDDFIVVEKQEDAYASNRNTMLDDEMSMDSRSTDKMTSRRKFDQDYLENFSDQRSTNNLSSMDNSMLDDSVYSDNNNPLNETQGAYDDDSARDTLVQGKASSKSKSRRRKADPRKVMNAKQNSCGGDKSCGGGCLLF